MTRDKVGIREFDTFKEFMVNSVNRIEKNVTEIKTNLDKQIKNEILLIKNNHLAHVDQDLQLVKERLRNLELKIAYYTGGATAIVQLIIWLVERYLGK